MKLLSRPAAATALLAAALAAAGCSSSGTTPTTSASSSTFGVNATGTVQFWARAVSSVLAKKLVDEFNASHKNLKVVLTLTQPNQAVTKLGTAIRAGTQPDVIGLNDINMPVFTREGAFMDLTSQISKLPYARSLSPGHMGLATYQGKEYGVPFWADLSLLWYNKTLFTRAGLNPNNPPTTFAQILSDAQKINALGHGINGFTFAGDCQGCLGFTVQPDVWAANSKLIDGPIGSQTANITGNTALQQVLSLYHTIWADKLVPPADRTQTGTTWGQDFAAGKIGIMPGGYGQGFNLFSASFKSQVGAVPLPGPDSGYSTFDGGDDFAILNGAKNQSGAWEFIQWVLQTQQQQQYPNLGATPIRTDLLTPSFEATYPFDAVALKALGQGYAPVTLTYNQTFNQPSGSWFAMFSTAVYDGNISGAMQQGQSGLTQELQRSGSS
jgi:multiple sugar transport system substrate-binding protein